MDWSILQIGGYPLRVSQTGTVVVGSGAAGFNAADQLWKFGCKDVALVTEGVTSTEEAARTIHSTDD